MDIVSKYIELRDKSQLEYDKELIKGERKSKKKEWKFKKQRNAAKTMQKRFRGNKSRKDLSIKRNDDKIRQEQMMEQMMEQNRQEQMMEQMMEQNRQTYQEPIYYSLIQNLQQPPYNEYYYDQRFQQQVIFDYNTQTYYDLYGTPL